MREDGSRGKRGGDVLHLLGKVCNKSSAVRKEEWGGGRGEEGREHGRLEAEELILVR